jgi:hypothetical protein
MAWGKLKLWLSFFDKSASAKNDPFCCPICRGTLTAWPSAEYPTFFCHRCGAYTMRLQQPKDAAAAQVA